MDMKEIAKRNWLSLGAAAFSVAVTIGGAIISEKMQSTLMNERIAILQRDQAKHELEKSEQIRNALQRADNHEKRIIRLEANFEVIQATLTEMREDLKTLVRAGRH